MRAYFAFAKKEFIESLRTYKLLIITVVFFLFGLMSPLFAKLLPELMKSAGVTIPGYENPTAFISWEQFFKNAGQLGLLILVIVFSGITASELSRGTIINMLAKGIKRSTVVLAKFSAASVIWTVAYLISVFVTWFYTAYYWDMTGMHQVFLSFFSLWLFGILLIVLVILGGIVFKNIFGSLFLTMLVVIVFALLLNVSTWVKYNPMTLTSANLFLLEGTMKAGDVLPAVFVGGGLAVVLLAASVLVFNRKAI